MLCITVIIKQSQGGEAVTGGGGTAALWQAANIRAGLGVSLASFWGSQFQLCIEQLLSDGKTKAKAEGNACSHTAVGHGALWEFQANELSCLRIRREISRHL